MKPKTTESHLDTVIANALETNMLAARAVLAAASPADAQLDFDRVTVRQQVRHKNTHGTADLVLHLWRGKKLQALVLIENKIDAGFTRDQPQRYRISRDAHAANGAVPVVATLLTAPLIYIDSSRLKDFFDGALPYEAILPLVTEDDRTAVELAIERASSPYEPVPVEAVMSFFDGYAQIVADVCPDIRVKANPNSGNARPEASRTIYFDTRASGFRRYPFLLKDNKAARNVSD